MGVALGADDFVNRRLFFVVLHNIAEELAHWESGLDFLLHGTALEGDPDSFAGLLAVFGRGVLALD